ncbi:hypothetical protein BMF77_01387 [Dolichospermum sp. UHCC 0315A]|nr:hypothetical protein BMF77_01387 [Dolichospermum sp. UHCC 0315A]
MRLCFFAPLREIECTSLNKIDEVRPVDLVSAKANLDQTYVKAPQNGVIFDIYTPAGEVVSNNGIVELGQINQMYISRLALKIVVMARQKARGKRQE